MTDASVVLLQEHHLPPDRCDEARVWCRKRGWKALFSPALQGDKDDSRSWTAGVAILVRDSLGLARWTAGLQEPVAQPVDDGIVPGRLVAGIVTLLDGVAIAVASGYWFSSQGLKECNLRLFSVVCQFASATRSSQLSHRTWNVLRCQDLYSRLQIETKPHALPSLVGAATIGF